MEFPVSVYTCCLLPWGPLSKVSILLIPSHCLCTDKISQDFSQVYTTPIPISWISWPGIFSAIFMSFLWGAVNCTQHFRCGLTWSEQTRRLTSLWLLSNALPDITQDTWDFHAAGCIAGSWTIWWPPRPLSPFLQSCFPASQPLVYSAAQGGLAAHVGLCLTLWEYYLPYHLPACHWPSCVGPRVQ